jgi:succinyl-diaminopimelate desuccinylase
VDQLVALAERLIAYDTCEPEAIRKAAGFIKGWLEAREIEAREQTARERPVLMAEVGPPDAPAVVLHGHLDVVPGLDGSSRGSMAIASTGAAPMT